MTATNDFGLIHEKVFCFIERKKVEDALFNYRTFPINNSILGYFLSNDTSSKRKREREKWGEGGKK